MRYVTAHRLAEETLLQRVMAGGRGRLTPIFAAALCATLCLAGASGARAQQQNVQGAWSWQFFGPQGPIENTLLLRGDGQFVQVVRLSPSSLMRTEGQYNVTPIDANRFHLQLHVQRWAPHSSCVVIAGFGQRCQPVSPPPMSNDVVTITSPVTMVLDGSATMQRDEQAMLLQQRVPDPAVAFGRTPVVPHMQQPVMPPMAGYTTPNGPGNVAAGQYHQQNQQFLNLYMRGCQQAENGQYYACQQ